MQMETMFLRLEGPVDVGSHFGDWRVTWAGGWTRDKLSFLVMVARPRRKPSRARFLRASARRLGGLNAVELFLAFPMEFISGSSTA